MKFIPYGHQYIDSADIEEVVKTLKSDWLTQGPKVAEFETKIGKYCGAKYAVAFSSGTAALHAAYAATGLKAGDEIITTPLTFSATAAAAIYCGAKPVFVDVKKDTLNINPGLIEKAITSKTRAIVAVDFAGLPCDYRAIFKIAKKHKLLVIEDAAHSLGAKYKNKKVGSFADMAIFSFHPAKLITTGEGGMVLTNNKNFYEKMKILRHHGIEKNPEKGAWHYKIKDLGFNYRLTDLQSALGLSQFRKIDKFLKRRKEIAKKYNSAFKNIEGLVIPDEKKYSQSAWHLYPVQVKKISRQKAFDELRKFGIGTQVHYIPLNLQPLYQKKFGYKNGDFPVAENYYNHAITLPLFPKMSGKDVEYVIKAVKKIWK